MTTINALCRLIVRKRMRMRGFAATVPYLARHTRTAYVCERGMQHSAIAL